MPNPVSKFVSKHRREVGMLALLLALVTFTTLMTIKPGGEGGLFGSLFLQADNLKNVARTIGIYGIFSIGVGIVIITAGIDLSVGSLMALLGVFFLYLITPAASRPEISFVRSIPEVSWPVAIFIVIALGTLLGFIHGLLVGKLKLQAFVVTLCGLLTYRGLARFYAKDTTVNLTDTKQDTSFLRTLGDGSLGEVISGERGTGFLHSIPMTFVYLVIFAAVASVILHRSVFGRYIYAVGRNETATRFSGINTGIVIAVAYLIAGFCTAFASIPYSIYTGSVQTSTHGGFFELYAIAAAVLGGCSLRGGEGSIAGILIGTSILIVLRNMVNLLGYPTPLSDAITGAVIFIGVIIDQHGATGLKKLLRRNSVRTGSA